MKNFKIALIIIAAFFVFTPKGYAQVTSDLKNKKEITGNKIQIRQKGKVAVKYVDPRTLKNGWHYLKIDAQIVYVQMNKGVASNIYVSDLRGKGMQKISFKTGASHFTCGTIGCACSGDEDCNDMFTKKVCSGYAWCIGNQCYCLKY